MDLHRKMTMYVTSTMTSPVTRTAKMPKWLSLKTNKVLTLLVGFLGLTT